MQRICRRRRGGSDYRRAELYDSIGRNRRSSCLDESIHLYGAHPNTRCAANAGCWDSVFIRLVDAPQCSLAKIKRPKSSITAGLTVEIAAIAEFFLWSKSFLRELYAPAIEFVLKISSRCSSAINKTVWHLASFLHVML
jgi:hypothetical protein